MNLALKPVISVGGLGTRFSEETHLKPKHIVEVEGRPILWQILKLYSARGINDYFVCAGHKSYVIKECFANYFYQMSDVTFNMSSNMMEVRKRRAQLWRLTIVDTWITP
jgi:glucose-1-phosphate cytidylyltransferase